MIDAVRDREAITRQVLALLGTPDIYDSALKTWWYVTLPGSNNLRLTPDGDAAFRQAELEYTDLPYTVGLVAENFAGMLTKLGRLECPFFLGMKSRKSHSLTVRIYDSRVAMMAVLHGSVEKYLDSQTRHAKY